MAIALFTILWPVSGLAAAYLLHRADRGVFAMLFGLVIAMGLPIVIAMGLAIPFHMIGYSRGEAIAAGMADGWGLLLAMAMLWSWIWMRSRSG